MSEAKAKPILFSGPMVRAILSGAKTQTRRLLKPQPDTVSDPSGEGRLGLRNRHDYWMPVDEARPYQPGDRLWVREAISAGDWDPPIYRADEIALFGKGTADQNNRWIPSIHMPRCASRITLEVTDVQVQRLQEISEEGARAEGVEGLCSESEPLSMGFAALWNSLHGPSAWQQNPWVCVVHFRRLR